MFFSLQAADEPAYLTVGTDVSAKYRGAFCEAKIKTVKRLVKVKVRRNINDSILMAIGKHQMLTHYTSNQYCFCGTCIVLKI